MSEKSVEDAARQILRILKDPTGGAKQGLMVNNFYKPFSQDGWRVADFNAGLAYARREGWVELNDGSMVRLTAAGVSAS
jgi:hypothetical protein